MFISRSHIHGVVCPVIVVPVYYFCPRNVVSGLQIFYQVAHIMCSCRSLLHKQEMDVVIRF